MVQIAWMMVTMLFLLGALRTNVTVVSTLAFTVLAFLFLALAQFNVRFADLLLHHVD
jgi:hypothetical protein